MAKSPRVVRDVLPIPDVPHIGLTTYDAKDPDTSYPPIRDVRPPDGAPNVLVILIDDVGEKIFTRLKDGAKVRLDGAALYQGEDLVAEGVLQSPESVADLLIEAKTGMSAQLVTLYGAMVARFARSWGSRSSARWSSAR